MQLIDVAETAVAPIPAGWKRHEGHLVGVLRGAHGGYVVIVDTTSSPLVRVEVVLPESVPAGIEARVAQACLQANRDWPGARLYWTTRFDSAIASEASLTVGPYASEIDPLVIRSLVLRCITTAASIPPLVSAVERGVSPYDAPSLASDNPILAIAASGRMLPASDAALMEACLAAAEHAEWPARRAEPEYGNGPNCAHIIVEHEDLGPPAIATVEARDGCLYATTVMLGPDERQRVPADRLGEVAELLNGLANRTSRCAFALDLEEGFVRTDLFLDTAGCTTPPSRELLCDFVFQAATSGAFFRQIVVSVAHQRVEPDVALEAFEVNVSQ